MAQPAAGALYLLLAVAVVDELSICEGARDGTSRRKQSGAAGGSQRNICDVSDRDSAVHCYCEPAREFRSASRAECWVFSGRVAIDDPVWSSFSSQPTLLSLAFSVRVDGALPYVPATALKPLRLLRQLSIKYGDITAITQYSLANLTSLAQLNLSQNNIQILHQYAIAHLPNLTSLYLEDNLIRNIRPDALYDLPALLTLVISKNNLSLLEDSTFRHAFNLLDLDLSKNSITLLNRHTFDGLANLRKLDLRRNRIHNVTEFTFAELWNLHELLLSKNVLKFISQRAFDGLSQLRKLSLDDNRLVTLPSKLFEGVRGLSSLDLRFNRIRELTYDHVRPIWDNLRANNSSLLIDGNPLECSCLLQWLYWLHNESSSITTRGSLAGAFCLPTTELVIPAFPLTSETGKNISESTSKQNILLSPTETFPCPKHTTSAAPPIIPQVLDPGTDSYRLYAFNAAEQMIFSCVLWSFWFIPLVT